jgi:hypothetical protein
VEAKPVDEESMRQAELDADIKERDEFVQRMLEREDQKTRKLAGQVGHGERHSHTRRHTHVNA